MKILQINCSSSGSTGYIMRTINERVTSNGDFGAYAYGIGQSSTPHTYRLSGYIGTHIHDQLSKVTGMQGYFSLVPTMHLLHIIKKESPDIVHLHNLHGNYLHLPTLFRFLKSAKTKVIITLHDCWLFTGKCPHFTDEGCQKWLTGCGDCCQLHVYPKSYLLDRTKRCLRDKQKWIKGLDNPLIITVSDWLKKTAEQSYLNKYRIQRVYNGVNTKKFIPIDCTTTRAKFNLENDFVILGVASRWHIRKGLMDFFELNKLLRGNEKIVLVGLTKQQIAELPRGILGIEHTESYDELVGLYNVADVLFNASTEETFGMVVAEAAACGTPVVVYNSTACAEIVDEEIGLVIEPHNVKDVYSAIQKIKGKGKKSYSQRCRERINNSFSGENMGRQYYDVYKVEINSKSGAKKCCGVE